MLFQIGVHGIRIEFVTERGSQRSATYLPEVASEQGGFWRSVNFVINYFFILSPNTDCSSGWSHQETIDSLLRKGGYRGTITESVRASVRLTRYRSDKLQLHASDYFAEQANGYRV